MNTIKRHVVVETLKVFVATTAVAMFLMTIGGGAKEGISQGLPPQIVLQTLPYIVPEMLRFVIPGCLLFAICSVFGRMASSNEVVALKSLGINPLTVVWPVLILAYALSVFTFWMYDVCAVWARPNLRELVSQSIDDIAYSFLRSNRSFSSREVSIVVKGVAQDRLLKPVVTIASGGEAVPVTLIAQQARLHSDAETGTLRIECQNGQLDMAGKGSLSFPGRFVHDIALRGFDEIQEDCLPPAALGMRALPKQVASEKKEIARLEGLLKASRQSEDATVQGEQYTQQLDYRRSRLFRLQAEPHRRLSNGLGCLCFAMVGVPVSLRRRSADTMSIFFLCFLPILLVYYPLLMTGENLARQGVYPQLTVWLADGVLLVVGGLLMMHMTRR